MARIALINPNTSTGTTEMMVAVARAAAPGDVSVEGLTAAFGAPLIVEPEALAVAGDAVVALAGELRDFDAVIVAAFGDPGRDRLADLVDVPVVGIAEAAMAAACAVAERFAVVTTTPGLAMSIRAVAAGYGHEAALVGVLTPEGDAARLMADPDAVARVLEDLAREAREELGAGAVVVGGGPLAATARALAGRLPIPVIEPVPAAVALAVHRLN